ncbi:MAG: Arc family DNA-binding protein [Treponema sp.]|nr:Arc family DNA-binding protein [Treponema sp.]
MDDKENPKKQIPLRLNLRLWEDLNLWAADEFRSLNGQIEYLLTECVKRRRKGSNDPVEPPGPGETPGSGGP